MWLIGFIAFVQCVCLPGAVSLRRFSVQGLNPLEQIVGVFAASLLANYVIVTLAICIGLHTPAVWWAIILAELAYLLWTWDRRHAPWNLELQWLDHLRRMRAGTTLAVITFSGSLIGFVLLFCMNWGSVYVGNDDVASWDRWAIEWSQNIFPTNASIYPQLLPTNGSISYILLGSTDVKMFAKATAPIYGVLILLLFLSLAVRRRDSSYLWGGAAFGFLLVHFMGTIFPTYGYADIPLAFFALLAFYCVYRNAAGPSPGEVVAGLFAAVGALLTKQGGIYVVVVMVLYAAYWKRWQNKLAAANGIATPPLFDKSASTLAFFVVSLSCVIWYITKLVQIQQGTDYSNMQLLTQTLHHGRSYPERLIATWLMFFRARAYTGPVVTVGMTGLLLGSLFVRQTRLVTLFVLAPFLLLYGLFFSYEIRNGIPAFPLIALLCGKMIHYLTGFVPSPLPNRKQFGPLMASLGMVVVTGWVAVGEPGMSSLPEAVIRFLGNPWIVEAGRLYGLPCLAAAGTLLIIVLAVRVQSGMIAVGRIIAAGVLVFAVQGAVANPRGALIATQIQAARTTMGLPAVNAKLYENIQKRHIKAGIVTDYLFLRALPDIKHLFRAGQCSAPCSIDRLRRAVAAYGDVRYVLMSDSKLSPETRQQIEIGGEFSSLFLVDGMRFIKVNRRPGALGTAPRPPELVSVDPATGQGRDQEFRFIFSSPDGPESISDVIVISNTKFQPAGACYFQWTRGTNLVTLANDNGVGWAGEQFAGKAGQLRNSQCTIDTSLVRIMDLKDQLELRIHLGFLPSFKGKRHFFATVLDPDGNATPYKDGATWEIP